MRAGSLEKTWKESQQFCFPEWERVAHQAGPDKTDLAEYRILLSANSHGEAELVFSL